MCRDVDESSKSTRSRANSSIGTLHRLTRDATCSVHGRPPGFSRASGVRRVCVGLPRGDIGRLHGVQSRVRRGREGSPFLGRLGTPLYATCGSSPSALLLAGLVRSTSLTNMHHHLVPWSFRTRVRPCRRSRGRTGKGAAARALSASLCVEHRRVSR